MGDIFGNPFTSNQFKNPFAVRQQTASPLAPYVQQVQQEEKKRFNLLQPVQWIFDLLSRGQYLTANVGEEIIKSFRTGEPLGQAAKDAITGAFEGLTGRRKGTWQTVLWGGKVDKRGEEEDYEFEGLFPEAPVPKWAKKVIGFAADVILDPTTYVSFGATSAARSGAKRYASNAVEVFLKRMQDAGELQKVAGKGIGREASKVYSTAYREALRTVSQGGKAAQEILRGNLTDPLMKMGQELGERIAKYETKYPQKFAGMAKWNEMMKKYTGVNELIDKVMPLAQYGAPGERAMKLGPMGFGKELLKGERYPAPLKLWDAVRNSFEASPVGSRVADAWYAINNKGIVGNIRKILGIRDPFGKFINELNVDSVKKWESASNMLKKQTYDVAGKMAPELQDQVRDLYWVADAITRGSNGKARVSPEVLLANDPMANIELIKQIRRKDVRDMVTDFMFNKLNVKDPQLLDSVTKVKGLTDEWKRVMIDARNMGVIEDFDDKLNYLPNIYKDITSAPMKRQKTKGIQAFGQEREYLKWLLDVDDVQAEKLIKEKGAGVLVTSLEDMLMYRAEAQARIMSRMGIFEDFKKFGIPEAEMKSALLKERLHRTPVQGLKPINQKAFEGLLFPEEVANIFERIEKSTKDPGLKALRNIWNSFTGWWKGFVTISTGFHVRNGIQNELNGWMKHGMQWFNPKVKAEAIAATIYGLAKDNPRPLLEKAAMGIDAYQRLLAKRVGPLSVKELADIAAQKVFSRTTLGFDVEGFQQVAKGFQPSMLNPMSRKFGGMRASRIVGEYLENSAKMQNFLMDFRSALGEGAESLEGKLAEYLPIEKLKQAGRYKDYDYAIEWAKDETRKWFFEYDDLTEVEKKLFRNVIPFYSWLRKNIPHQLAIIATDPSIYSILPKAERAMTGTEIDPEMLPEWMRAAGAIPFAKDAEGNPVMWIPNLGYADLNKIPINIGQWGEGPLGLPFKVTGREMIDDIVGSAHPALKQIVQQIPKKGYDVFFRKDLDYNAKAPYLLRYFAKVPFMLEFMDGLARVIGREEGLGFVVDDEGMLRMNGKIAKLLEDNLPVLRSMERVMYLGEEAIPGLDKAIEGAIGAKDTHEGLQRLLQIISYWGGLKFSKVDLEEEKKRWGAEVYEKATEKRAKTEAYTPLAKQRQLTAQKATATKYRRVGLGL